MSVAHAVCNALVRQYWCCMSVKSAERMVWQMLLLNLLLMFE